MLVLTREIDESIIISDGTFEAEITIVEVRGDKVRLGITAPQRIRVDRKEISERRKAEAEAEREANGVKSNLSSSTS